MIMPVMNIRVMGVGMDHWLVKMCMGMRFPGRIAYLVVFVVGVEVSMFHRLVVVLVFVAFREMQPNPQRHQDGGQAEPNSERVAQK